jgi:murein DD-endopeptidase MepM/ murein hydrolase activator NlpD
MQYSGSRGRLPDDGDIAGLERSAAKSDAPSMRPHAVAALVVLAAVLALAPVAAAAGGAPAPLHSGGAAYGSALPRPDARPVASRLSVAPRETVAGAALPEIRVRLRQRGISRVRARVVVVRLPGSRPVARISLGWVKPGSRVKAAWPAGVRLRAGRYVVRVHAKDPRGRTLARSARSPGRARLVVHRAPVAPPAPAAAPAPVVPFPAAGPSPGGKGVFPVAGAFDFGGVTGRFGATRTGHIHEGQDILAASGVPVVAPYAGVVSSTRYQAHGAGEYVVLDAIDGRDYFFAHCTRGSTAVAEGAAVGAGQPLCTVGTTGDSEGPHLHFEIWTVGWRIAGGAPIDPLPELRTWAGV